MKLQSAVLLSLVAAVSAKWTNNLNYRSPSEHHPFMGIAIHKVVRRSNYATPFNASQLNFTHGVASGDPYSDSVILVRLLQHIVDTGVNQSSGHDAHLCTTMTRAMVNSSVSRMSRN